METATSTTEADVHHDRHVLKQPTKVLLTLSNVLLPKEKLTSTPSMIDGLDLETEVDLRIVGCEWIQTAGILLKLPQVRLWIIAYTHYLCLIMIGIVYAACRSSFGITNMLSSKYWRRVYIFEEFLVANHSGEKQPKQIFFIILKLLLNRMLYAVALDLSAEIFIIIFHCFFPFVLDSDYCVM